MSKIEIPEVPTVAYAATFANLLDEMGEYAAAGYFDDFIKKASSAEYSGDLIKQAGLWGNIWNRMKGSLKKLFISEYKELYDSVKDSQERLTEKVELIREKNKEARGYFKNYQFSEWRAAVTAIDKICEYDVIGDFDEKYAKFVNYVAEHYNEENTSKNLTEFDKNIAPQKGMGESMGNIKNDKASWGPSSNTSAQYFTEKGGVDGGKIRINKDQYIKHWRNGQVKEKNGTYYYDFNWNKNIKSKGRTEERTDELHKVMGLGYEGGKGGPQKWKMYTPTEKGYDKRWIYFEKVGTGEEEEAEVGVQSEESAPVTKGKVPQTFSDIAKPEGEGEGEFEVEYKHENEKPDPEFPDPDFPTELPVKVHTLGEEPVINEGVGVPGSGETQTIGTSVAPTPVPATSESKGGKKIEDKKESGDPDKIIDPEKGPVQKDIAEVVKDSIALSFLKYPATGIPEGTQWVWFIKHGGYAPIKIEDTNEGVEHYVVKNKESIARLTAAWAKKMNDAMEKKPKSTEEKAVKQKGQKPPAAKPPVANPQSFSDIAETEAPSAEAQPKAISTASSSKDILYRQARIAELFKSN